MAVLPTGIGPVTGYQIERSLRFNSADSAYLNRTPASASNRKTWTWSGWVKKSALGSLGYLFSVPDSTGHASLRFTTSDTLEWAAFTAANGAATTNAVFRDASAWYHIVFAMDTTQATTTNRIKLYVNNVLQTFSSYTAPTQNQDTPVNNTVEHDIGKRVNVSEYLSSYLTEINFIDGQALTPSSFGETDSATGVWKPKAYTGTYGTNGFFLKFADNSNTTAGTLGKDSSGNGNNWTPNNFSVTAGAGNDSLVDSPTSYGTGSAGGDVRGNYATWNPLAKGGSTTLSNGNLNVLGSINSSGNNNFSTFIPSSEKWYFEASPANTYGYSYVGVSLDGGLSVSSSFVGGTANSVGVELGNGTIWRNGSNQSTGGTGVSAGEILMVAFEPSSGKVWAGRNGTWYNSGNPAAGTGQVATIPTVGAIGPAVSPYSGSGTISFNFGQRAFAYTAPSGFKALCTQNLPTTAIVQGDDYFNIALYAGNGAGTNTVTTNFGFTPDFIWIKNRTAAADHALQSSPMSWRYLSSNTTGADGSAQVGNLTDNSFLLATANSIWNASSNNYAAWCWKANGAGSSNTAGTITSTVSANTTSGFSIVTYGGSGASGTVGHGLGVAPSMIIVKNRSAAENWMVYRSDFSAPASDYMQLNTTGAKSTFSNIWGGTATSSVFYLGGNYATINSSGNNYVAYCFAAVAGYSAFGSYTGNGSTDGPFVYTGFRPRFIMWKNITTSGYNWEIIDTARDTYNVMLNVLGPNSSLAESSFAGPPYLDSLSNGFKVKTGSATSGYQNINNSGDTYIYAAFAESPFKYSLAR